MARKQNTTEEEF